MLFKHLTITLNGVDITHLIELDSFPEWFEESMKGQGYFNYEVKPLVFVIKTTGSGVSPARGDWMEITDNTTGLFLLRGKVDEVANDECPTPELTVFPQALLLKDTIVGDEVILSTEETVRDYIFPVQHIRTTVNDLLNKVNTEHGSFMYANEASIPDAINTGKFTGDVLYKLGSDGFLDALMDLLGFSDKLVIRKNATSGNYFLIEKIGGFFPKVIIEQGALANLSLGTIAGYDFGRWPIPAHDFSIKFPDIRDKVWSLEAGGLEYLGEFPNADGVGSLFEGEAATNVPSSMVSSFATEKGLFRDQEIVASFDYDDFNSYALVSGRFKNDRGNDVSSILLSFETTFDDNLSGHYRDSTALEILRDLAIATNRWMYVDRNGLFYLLPRDQARATVTYPTRYTLVAEKRVRKETDPDIRLRPYKENDDGEAISYGLKLRQSQVDSLANFYRDLFTGEVTTRTLTMLSTVEDDILKLVSWENLPAFENIGTVIGIDHSFLKPIARVTVENGV